MNSVKMARLAFSWALLTCVLLTLTKFAPQRERSALRDHLSPEDTKEALPRPWMELVASNLEPFATTGITSAMLELETPSAACLILNNTLYVDTTLSGPDNEHTDLRLRPTLLMFQKLLCREDVPDVELVLSWTDHPRARRASPARPIISWSSSIEHWDIIIPYARSFYTLPFEQKNSVQPINHTIWATKIDKAYWRGSTTGGRYYPESWRYLSRPALVQLCHQNPADCDAAFTGFLETQVITEELKSQIARELGPFSDWVSWKDFLKHRMIINVDGNAAPQTRTFKAVSGDSLLLQQESPFLDYFSKQLQPYKHYVPFRHDLSDLLDKISWVRKNEAAALDIIRNAQAFAVENLNGRSVNAYLTELLLQYSQLQRFTPALREGLKPFKFQSEEERAEFHRLAGGEGCISGSYAS